MSTSPVCHLPGGWSMLDAAPGYSAFAGILGGFVFAGLVVLMTESRISVEVSSKGDESLTRARTLMHFLPALLSLLISSFLFSEVSGEQVCARGYVEGLLAAGLLGMGALGVFSGIALMLEVFGEAQEDLRRTARIITYIAYLTVVCLITVSGYDIAVNAYKNRPPGYLTGGLVSYGVLMLVLLGAVRLWFVPSEKNRDRAQLQAVYATSVYIVVTVVVYAVLTSYSPADWRSIDDWKTWLALSVTLVLPALSLLAYARAIPHFTATIVKSNDGVSLLPTRIECDSTPYQPRHNGGRYKEITFRETKVHSDENQPPAR